MVAYQRGNARTAVTLIERASHLLPNVAELHANLGNAQQAIGEAAAAAASCRRAIALKPDLATAHAGLARALNDQRDHAGALASAQRAAALDARLVDAPVQMAAALAALGRPVEAGNAYQVALRLDPDQPAVLARFGQVLSVLGHDEAALTCHRRALALQPDDPQLQLALARSLMHRFDTAAAIAPLRRATELAPDLVEAWQRLGTCLSASGAFVAAGDAYRRALTLDPVNAESLRGLAAIDQPAGDPADLDRLRALLAREDVPAEQRIAAGFAAGERLDRLDRYDEAFPCFAIANALVRARRQAEGAGFDAAQLHQQVDDLIAHCSAAFLANATSWGTASELPVLVVGMPRSGTTLVEQILASHAAVAGAGELPDLNLAARAMMLENPRRRLAAWDPASARRHAAAYLEKLAALGGRVSRVVDKMPDNVFVLGIAAAMLPDARFILCRRDLRDVCLSCFFQHFVEGNEFSNDLADCGRRAVEVDRLMTHWERVLAGPRVMTVRYEALVADVETEARRLSAFLGLPWDPACLQFHRTARPVLTASSWQVRQQVYGTSVGRWRHYARNLGPLLETLRDARITDT